MASGCGRVLEKHTDIANENAADILLFLKAQHSLSTACTAKNTSWVPWSSEAHFPQSTLQSNQDFQLTGEQ